MFQLKNITTCLAIFFLSFIGCNCEDKDLTQNPQLQSPHTTQSTNNTQTSQQGSPNTTQGTTNSSKALPNATQDTGKLLIVLSPGLTGSSSCFEKLIEEMKQYCSNAYILPLSSVEGDKTINLSIEQQAKENDQEITKFCQEKKISLENTCVILIGHSQGFLRLYKMYHDFKENYKNAAMIALAAPLEGAPIINNAQNILNMLNNLNLPADLLNLLPSLVRALLTKDLTGVPGVADLKPKSQFLNWVKDTLPKTKTPILAIGAVSNSKLNILNNENNGISEIVNNLLNNLLPELLVTENPHTGEHDWTLPLDSQLGLNIAKGNKNFKTHTIKGAVHDKCINTGEDSILEHPDTFKGIKKFISSVCPQATQKQRESTK